MGICLSTTLEYVPDSYTTQEMGEKAVDNYPSALIHVCNCYKTQKMYEKAGVTSPFMLELVPSCFKTQEILEKAVSKISFMLKYYLGKHKSLEICDKTPKACLSLLQTVPDWTVKNNMLKNVDNAVFLNEDIYSLY